MSATASQRFVAFDGDRLIASGEPAEVALEVKRASLHEDHGPLLVFDDLTSRAVDFDLRGSDEEVVARSADQVETAKPRGRGRPRLGVVAREVTLLPRHWAWLNSQPGSASVTLRRLVEQARRDGEGKDRVRTAQDAAYRFMSAIAGNQAGFEEATRALFAGDRGRFLQSIDSWPKDVRLHTVRLADRVFVEST